MLNVRKRDGSIEPFSLDKLINSIAKAGLNIKESEKVAAIIYEWAKENESNNIILTVKIREEVIKNLEKKYPLEASNYETYSKI